MVRVRIFALSQMELIVSIMVPRKRINGLRTLFTNSITRNINPVPGTTARNSGRNGKQDPNSHFYGRKVLGGCDNYFNNGEYRSGWTLYERVIGSPFMTPGLSGGITRIINNRVIAHHIGMKGMAWQTTPYKLMLSIQELRYLRESHEKESILRGIGSNIAIQKFTVRGGNRYLR